MLALIDCDNFFVSCERIFQPKLKKRPVVVLSNNDGCVIARSTEAKNIGIPMCAPYFKIEKILKSQNGTALSSNHELYSDISGRIMEMISRQFGGHEIYSIDEAFVHLQDKTAPLQTMQNFRQKILKEIGIPVSIGISPSKTLCKVAGEYAKMHDKVFCLTEPQKITQILQQTDVSEIWGIGRKTAQKLNFLGIFTAQELQTCPPAALRKNLGINIEKTILELNGRPCGEINAEETQHTITFSRSFENEISQYERLKEILSEFVDNACIRLRRQNSIALGISIFIASNRFKLQQPQYYNSTTVTLPQASCNTAKFIKAMISGLNKIYRPNIFYKRAGVTLLGIEDINSSQIDFWEDQSASEKEQKLMRAFDAINAKLGQKSIFFGGQPILERLCAKQQFKSQRYTTSWSELALVH